MPVKVAVIGAGGMLAHHVAGFRQSGAEVVTVVGRNPNKVISAASALGIDNVCTNVDEMLANKDIDAVSIIVPNKYHAPLAIECLQAGKHVFCEKPPAMNAEEVRDMIAAAQSAGKTLMFNYNNRARPESYKLKQLIDDGSVGRIDSAQAKWVRRCGIPGFGGWFTTKSLSGGGPLIDLLHMIDLAMYMMGYPEPAHVLAQTFNTFIDDRTFKGPWGIADVVDGVTDVESAAHGFITFKTGQTLAVQASWAEMIKREEVSVSFQGAVAGGLMQRLFEQDGIDETAINTLELYRHIDGRPVNESLTVDDCQDMGRSRSAANFIATITGAEAPLNSPNESLILMQVIDALYQSADTNRPVSLV